MRVETNAGAEETTLSRPEFFNPNSFGGFARKRNPVTGTSGRQILLREREVAAT